MYTNTQNVIARVRAINSTNENGALMLTTTYDTAVSFSKRIIPPLPFYLNFSLFVFPAFAVTLALLVILFVYIYMCVCVCVCVCAVLSTPFHLS